MPSGWKPTGSAITSGNASAACVAPAGASTRAAARRGTTVRLRGTAPPGIGLTPSRIPAGMAAMPVPRMHDDEVEVDDALVRRLVGSQVPHLADRPLARVETWGTDHVIY